MLIIDTACQSPVAEEAWLRSHEALILQETGVHVRHEQHAQTFTFGEGFPTQSTTRSLLPCSAHGRMFAIRVCEVPQPIPCLLSRSASSQMGMILNSVTGKVCLTELGCRERKLATSACRSSHAISEPSRRRQNRVAGILFGIATALTSINHTVFSQKGAGSMMGRLDESSSDDDIGERGCGGDHQRNGSDKQR